MKFSKKVVLGIIMSNVIFTAIVFYLFYKTGSEPSYLIGAWFAFTTVELWSLAGIKKEESKSEAIVEGLIEPRENMRGD